MGETVTSGMQDPEADSLFALVAPDLPGWEALVREAEPAAPDARVLDLALRRALAHLRHEVSQQTFAYLRWRAQRVRAAAADTRAAVAAARLVRSAARAEAGPEGAVRWCGAGDSADPAAALPFHAAHARTFRAADHCAWSVHEAVPGAVEWARGARCLIFHSALGIRRVWTYPADWRSLTDAELEALSWRT
jgi:hypothetical protein